jgi:ribonuclease-3
VWLLTPEEFLQASGLSFADPSLLRRALTHRSYINEHPEAVEDNERLEYLGDAALDFITASWIYSRFPEMNEGELTRLRSALVRTEQLAAFAQEINLGDALFLGKGEAITGGRERHALLCAAFEALMGALYLDAGLEAVSDFMQPRLLQATQAAIEDERLLDARSQLQMWAQAEIGTTPQYETVRSSGPDHEREFVVAVRVGDRISAQGAGRSKQEAAQQAAAQALAEIQSADAKS